MVTVFACSAFTTIQMTVSVTAPDPFSGSPSLDYKSDLFEHGGHLIRVLPNSFSQGSIQQKQMPNTERTRLFVEGFHD